MFEGTSAFPNVGVADFKPQITPTYFPSYTPPSTPPEKPRSNSLSSELIKLSVLDPERHRQIMLDRSFGDFLFEMGQLGIFLLD